MHLSPFHTWAFLVALLCFGRAVWRVAAEVRRRILVALDEEDESVEHGAAFLRQPVDEVMSNTDQLHNSHHATYRPHYRDRTEP